MLKINFLLSTFLFSMFCYSQTLVLRPSVGSKYYWAKQSNFSFNNFDETYKAKHKFSQEAVAISVELLYPKHSFELSYTKQFWGSKFSTNFKSVGVEVTNLSNGGLSQFQLNYNRFINLKSKNFYGLIGTGLGLGINRPTSVYIADTTFTVYREYSLSSPNDYVDVNLRQSSIKKISYSAIFKAGIIVKLKNIERLRVLAIYNLGLNNFLRTNIEYSHTNKNYSGISYYKGSQFSILVSIPIYLKRFKKK